MSKFELKIELLSDLCVSDGSVYNSMIDTDCCYDSYGFPYIPARRIKGCLRECALELKNWEIEIEPDNLFGGKDEPENASKIRIGNAKLEKFDEYLKEIDTCKGHLLCHPQLILNNFSYIRTQTKLDQETGIADDHTLRTMRVVNKGLVFIADVDCPEELKDQLENCCRIFKHIGLMRTRGMGEIAVTLVSADDKTKTREKSAHTEWKKGAVRIDYEITINEPVICKSIAGGESKTLDYIEGGKIRGLILSAMKKEGKTPDKIKAMIDSVQFSNAYIGSDGHRYTEVGANLQSIKNNKTDYVDVLKKEGNVDGIQLNQMKHCYVRIEKDALYQKKVAVEERYHHSRPADKSIGRAVENQDGYGMLYQLSSISENQKFYGFILGETEELEKVYRYLTESTSHLIGYSHSAEYGNISVRVISTGEKNKEKKKGTELIVKLNAPAIIYSKQAMYSIDQKDLLDELCAAFNIEKDDIEKQRLFINYTSVGGYNVTWGFRKPTIEVFDKGTVVSLKLKKEIALNDTLFIGERNAEGFGEVSISFGCAEHTKNIKTERKASENLETYTERAIKEFSCGQIVDHDEDISKTLIVVKDGTLLSDIADRIFKDYLASEASRIAMGSQFAEESCRSTISNMLVGFDSYVSIADIEDMVKKRYGEKKSDKKMQKKSYADEILQQVENYFSSEDGERINLFKSDYRIGLWDACANEKYQLFFMKQFLIHLKYQIRLKKRNSEEQREEDNHE